MSDAVRPDELSRPHDLVTFMHQDAIEMQSEYNRIRSISKEDPGTAGDEGEETWAELLRNWIPESYQVVTKGRLLAADGRRGPQLDVLVLRPGYPRRLVNKKLYLVGGVAAAFECKNTLRPEHLERAFEQARVVDNLSSRRTPTAFSELVSEVFFGVLAHSTVWTSEPENQRRRIDHLLQAGLSTMTGPRSAPGLVCVADVGEWSILRMTYDGPGLIPEAAWQARRNLWGGTLPPEGAATVSYARWVDGEFPADQKPPNPIAAAVANILGRLAHDDVSVRPMSQYFFAAGLGGSGVGVATRQFPLDVYPAVVRSQLPHSLTNGIDGSSWSLGYPF